MNKKLRVREEKNWWLTGKAISQKQYITVFSINRTILKYYYVVLPKGRLWEGQNWNFSSSNQSVHIHHVSQFCIWALIFSLIQVRLNWFQWSNSSDWILTQRPKMSWGAILWSFLSQLASFVSKNISIKLVSEFDDILWVLKVYICPWELDWPKAGREECFLVRLRHAWRLEGESQRL